MHLQLLRHVPDIRKNLISLGTLEQNDFTYSSKGGKMKTCKGSLVVILGVKLFNNLYKLIRDIVASSAAIFPYQRLQTKGLLIDAPSCWPYK